MHSFSLFHKYWYHGKRHKKSQTQLNTPVAINNACLSTSVPSASINKHRYRSHYTHKINANKRIFSDFDLIFAFIFVLKIFAKRGKMAIIHFTEKFFFLVYPFSKLLYSSHFFRTSY